MIIFSSAYHCLCIYVHVLYISFYTTVLSTLSLDLSGRLAPAFPSSISYQTSQQLALPSYTHLARHSSTRHHNTRITI